MTRKLSTRPFPLGIPKANPDVKPPRIVPLGAKPLAAQVGIGILCASYWRGMWYICDDNLFPDNQLHSGAASLALGSSGLALSQGLMANLVEKEMKSKKIHLPRRYSSLARFGSLYVVSTSCVLVWRGAWVLWDEAYERYRLNKDQAKATDPGHLTKSGILSHGAALAGLLLVGRFASVLAPPARICILKDTALKQSTKTWKDYSAAAKWFFK